MTRTFIASILFFQLFLPAISRAEVDYSAPQYVYEFAEYLYQEGDYLRAAGEFQRYLLLAEDSTHNAAILLKVGECYLLGGQYQQSITFFQRVIDENPPSNYKENAAYQIAYSYTKSGDYHQSVRYLHEYLSQCSTICGKFSDLLGINYLYLRDWEKAHQVFSSRINQGGQSFDSLAPSLDRLALAGTQISYKSPLVAGMMSSLIPGAGKMYAGRMSDGLYSLITIGLTVWQAYGGFRNNGTHSVKGWIYGSLAGVFYLGNIYGSIVSVRIHNENLGDELLSRVSLSLGWE